MATITIKYTLSQRGQRESLKAGGSGEQVQKVTLKPSSPEWPQAVELAAIDSTGAGLIDLYSVRHAYAVQTDGKAKYGPIKPQPYDAVPTVAELLADAAAAKAADAAGQAAYDAECAAKHEAEVARVLACPLSDLIDVGPGGPNSEAPAVVKSGPWNDLRTAARHAEAVAEVARLNAEAKARRAAEAAEDVAKLERLKEWVRAHGDETTRLRLEEGYDSWISTAREQYADNIARSVSVASGLTLDDRELYDSCDAVRYEERKSPDAAEIKALRRVRDALPVGTVAKLVYAVYRGGDLEEDVSRAEVQLTIAVPGSGTESRHLLVND